MAQEHFAQVGSGTVPFTRGVLPTSERGITDSAGGIRRGTQVVVANPEDFVAVDAWAVSGITVPNGVATKILGPDTNPLPRSRLVQIAVKDDSSTIVVADREDRVLIEGFPLRSGAAQRQYLSIPLMHNTEIWAAGVGAAVEVSLLIT